MGVAAQARSQYAALSSALEGANAKKVDFAAALSLLFKVRLASVCGLSLEFRVRLASVCGSLG